MTKVKPSTPKNFQDNESEQTQSLLGVIISDDGSLSSSPKPSTPKKRNNRRSASLKKNIRKQIRETECPPPIINGSKGESSHSTPLVVSSNNISTQPSSNSIPANEPQHDYWREILLESHFERFGSLGENYNNDELYNLLVAHSNVAITSASFWKKRINVLLQKFAPFISPMNSAYGTDKIKSKGYKRVMEILHKLCCVCRAGRSQKDFSLIFNFEALELSELLMRLVMVFISEGTENNSFEAADNFLDLTAKEREKSRKRVQQNHQEDVIKNMNQFMNRSSRRRGGYDRNRGYYQRYQPYNIPQPASSGNPHSGNKPPFQRRGYNSNTNTNPNSQQTPSSNTL
ncbi:hypothetical protein FDP41_003644 [Naegleria fowleri]|uniref:Uncharacterized protein n=1 Tax=Naegleria fowleri TaxID=5763 RepID=A0A6A5BSH7_NAEFO|nr:uncharacterized protein FDP41_003644 [Naegleria fowleri]KAF0977652.1 hypothetical protein FDP41_003644 [Naegleria fowleri]